MKRILKAIVASVCLAMGASGAAFAENVIVAFSPYGDATAKTDEIKHFLAFATEHIELGEDAVFINGESGEQICTFSVPDRKAYRAPKAKLQVNGACVRSLLNFAKSNDAIGRTGAMNIPILLRSIGDNYDMSHYRDVVISGSPIWHSDEDPRFSMLGAYVPSDGHIIAPRAASPYSMVGYEDAFKEARVHFAFDGVDWAENDQHFELIKRFWSLEIDTLGGKFVSFDNDLSRALGHVGQISMIGEKPYMLDENAKPEMIGVPIYRGLTVPIYERQLSSEPLDPSALSRARGVEIGISWDCACDLDLYVIPAPGAEAIFFGNSRTAQGRLNKDFRSGAELHNGYETVQLYDLTDLSKMRAAVNFYSGAAPDGVVGEIRLAVGSDTFAAPFRIDAVGGNEGDDAATWSASGAAPNDGWIVVNAAAIAGK